MCFSTVRNAKATPAKSDISAFKVLRVEGDVIKSPIRDNRWTQGKVKIAHGFVAQSPWGSVFGGIHCYRSVTDAQSGFVRTTLSNSKEKIFLVTIPKGTLVYTNDTQYCAERVKLELLRPLQMVHPVKKGKK